MEYNEILERIGKYSYKERTMRLFELIVIEVKEGFISSEEAFELGVIQGIRLKNGEIEEVIKKINETEL